MILILLSFCYIVYSQKLPEDVFLDPESASLALYEERMCVLTKVATSEIGGRANCFGAHHRLYDKILKPPNDIFVQIVASGLYFCGLTIEQKIKCWGKPDRAVDEFPGFYTQITSSDKHMCAISTDGNIMCNFKSYITNNDSDEPGEESDGETKTNKPKPFYVQISCSTNHCCALDNNGHVHCDGKRVHESVLTTPHYIVTPDGLGNHDVLIEEDGYADEEVVTIGDKIHTKFIQISVSDHFSCGIRYHDGAIECWGDERSTNAIPMYNIQGPFRQVSADSHCVCGIFSSNDSISCTGECERLVHNPKKSKREPWPNALYGEYDQVKVFRKRVCAVTMDSELYCWGRPFHGTPMPTDLDIA